MTIIIRPAIQEDISVIAEIESSFPSSWNEVQIAAEFKRSDSIILVASKNQLATPVGWSCLRYVVPEAEVLKITVHPVHQRCGYGILLLENLCQKALFMGCMDIYLEVRADNHPARNLYLKSGFSEQGIRRKYYLNPVDDAVLYAKKLIP